MTRSEATAAARKRYQSDHEPSNSTQERDSLLLWLVSLYAAGSATAIGVFIMAIWLFQVQWIADNIPLLYECKFNTALGLALGGIGVVALNLNRPAVARLAALVMLAIAFATLLEYLADIDLGIDQLLAKDTWNEANPHGGRMSTNSITNFVLTGIALYVTAFTADKRWRSVPIVMLLGTLFVSLTSLGGYFAGLSVAYTWGSYAQISPQTALGFLCIAAGISLHIMSERRTTTSPIPWWWLAAIYCVFILWFDLATPLGVAAGIGYVPLVFMCLWSRSLTTAFLLGAIATGLIIAGYILSPFIASAPWIVFVNRTLSIGAVWFTAIIVYLSRKDSLARDESERHFKALFDTVLDGVITIDGKGTIETFNPAAARMLGYEPHEVIGHNVNMLMPEPYRSGHDSYIGHFHLTNERRIIGIGREVAAQRKDGSVFPIELGVAEMRDQDKRTFVGTIRDISERKKAEDEIRQYVSALQISNRELDEFAYIASHDLKEPLRGVSNHARFLQEDYAGKLEEDGERRLDRMIFLAKRMERLIDDLLYFSRLGRQQFAIQDTDLYAVISEIEEMLEATLQEENAFINVVDPLPSVVCDRPRIVEVFRNLITNAIKYNDKREKHVRIGHLIKDGESTYYVQDNGMGIAPEHYEDVFRIFKRLNQEKDDVRGNGVGLTFVKKIIERHSGHIWIESEPGEGTTFFFTIGEPESAIDTHAEARAHLEAAKDASLPQERA